MKERLATYIPKSERELGTVKEGELVKISIPAADSRNNIWTIFVGNKDGIDTFMAQELKTQKEDAHMVAIYSALRRTHQFDENLGVLLSSLHYAINFVGYRRGEEYVAMVNQLKQANLWREQ